MGLASSGSNHDMLVLSMLPGVGLTDCICNVIRVQISTVRLEIHSKFFIRWPLLVTS